MSVDVLVLFTLLVLVLLVAVMYYALFELITANLRKKYLLLSGKEPKHETPGTDPAQSPRAWQGGVPGVDDPHTPPRASPPSSWDDGSGEWTEGAGHPGFQPQGWEGAQTGWQTPGAQPRSGWESPFMPRNTNPFAPPKGQAREWQVQDTTDARVDDRTDETGPAIPGTPPVRPTQDPPLEGRRDPYQSSQSQTQLKPQSQTQLKPQPEPEPRQTHYPPTPEPWLHDPHPPGRAERGAEPYGEPTGPIPSLRMPFDSGARRGPSIPDDSFRSDRDTPEDTTPIKLPRAEELPVNDRERYQISGQQVVKFREPGTVSDTDLYGGSSTEREEEQRSS